MVTINAYISLGLTVLLRMMEGRQWQASLHFFSTSLSICERMWEAATRRQLSNFYRGVNF